MSKWEITAYTTLRDNEMLRRMSIVSASDISRDPANYYSINVYVGTKGGGLDLIGSWAGNKNTLEAGTHFALIGNYANRRMRNGESIVVSLFKQGSPSPSASAYTLQVVMANTGGQSAVEQPLPIMETMDGRELRSGHMSVSAHAIESSGIREWSISVPLQDPRDNAYVEINGTTGYGKTSQLGSGTASASTVLLGNSTWGIPPSPWTYVVLGSDFSTTAATAQNVTNFNFTPASNKKYMIEMRFMLRSANTAVGPRPGIAWPTGISNHAATIRVADGATGTTSYNWGPTTTQVVATPGVASTSHSWLAIGDAIMVMGTASGNFQVVLLSETAGTSVTMKADSYFRYREFP